MTARGRPATHAGCEPFQEAHLEGLFGTGMTYIMNL